MGDQSTELSQTHLFLVTHTHTHTHTETHTDTHANIQEYCSLLLNWKPFFVILISFTVITFCLSHSHRLSLIISFVGFHFQLSSKLISISLSLSLSFSVSQKILSGNDPGSSFFPYSFFFSFFFFCKNIYLSLPLLPPLPPLPPPPLSLS